jgi:hypothetical protein
MEEKWLHYIERKRAMHTAGRTLSDMRPLAEYLKKESLPLSSLNSVNGSLNA